MVQELKKLSRLQELKNFNLDANAALKGYKRNNLKVYSSNVKIKEALIKENNRKIRRIKAVLTKLEAFFSEKGRNISKVKNFLAENNSKLFKLQAVSASLKAKKNEDGTKESYWSGLARKRKLLLKNKKYSWNKRRKWRHWKKLKRLKKNKVKKSTRLLFLGKNKEKKPVNGAAIFRYKVNITIKQHNVFCSLTTTKDNKTLHVCSSGKYKIKMSRKTLIYTYYWFLRRFFTTVKKLIRVPSVKKMLKENSKISRPAGLIVFLVSPRKISDNIINTTRRFLIKRRRRKARPFVLKIFDKKIFNGCRPPKKVRKKRRRMRSGKR